MNTTRKNITVAALLAFIALILGMWLSHFFAFRPTPLQSGTVLDKPRTLSPFKLTDTQGQAFTNANLKGKWTLFFFGFTHCPSICPTTMAVLQQAYNKLQPGKVLMPQVVLVSIDPQRDTPKKLQQYVQQFNKNFIGVTGSQQQLDKLTKELSIVYMKVKAPNADSESSAEYQIDHSGTLLLIAPTGQLYAIFSMPHDANKIAQDYATITKESKLDATLMACVTGDCKS